MRTSMRCKNGEFYRAGAGDIKSNSKDTFGTIFQMWTQHRLSSLYCFHDLPREIMYSLAAFLTPFQVGHLLPAINSVIDKK